MTVEDFLEHSDIAHMWNNNSITVAHYSRYLTDGTRILRIATTTGDGKNTWAKWYKAGKGACIFLGESRGFGWRDTYYAGIEMKEGLDS